MTIESKKVTCKYCDGAGKGSTPFRSVVEELKAEATDCFGCDSTGEMEIRKSEKLTGQVAARLCGGKGFKDVWIQQHEEHDTIDCIECNATGGIPYLANQ